MITPEKQDAAGPPAPDARRRWRVLAGSALVVAFGLPALWGSTLGLFLDPIQHDLGWTRTDIAFSLMLTTLAGFLVVPAAGWLVDRVRLRPLILAGVLLQSIGIAALALLGRSVWGFYALSIALTICGTGASLLTMSKLIQGWFTDSLGTALGILFASDGVGAVAQPLLAQALIQHYGWRKAYVCMGVLGFLIAGLAAWFTVEDEAPPKSAAGTVSASSVPQSSLLSLLRDRNCWILIIWNVLSGYALGGIQFHFAPLLQDRGATPAQSALSLSLMGAGGLIGNLGAGWLMDRLSARRLGSALMLVPMLAALAMFVSNNVWLGLLSAIMFGLCSRGALSLTAFLIGRHFDSTKYGQTYSLVFLAGAVGGGLAPWIMGLMQERAGNYNLALIVDVVIFASSAVAVALLPEAPRAAHASRTLS